jgi:glutamyl-tRNA reductase
MVLGEPQILGQVKDAYQAARAANALTPILDRLFQQTFAVAKRVRTDTRIGAHPVSVAFAAVRLAQQAFTQLENATVLLIGAGDTIELAARHLVEHKARRLLVANRTLEHAHALAARVGGYALPLAEIDRHLAEADIVLSATAAREPVLQRSQLEQALRARRHRPMFLLDLAVPRDIAADVAGLEDVYLYTIDDLDQVIEDSRRSRLEAAGQAQAIIDLQVQHFLAWWAGSLRQDALLHLRAQGDAVRDQVAARARAMLAQGRPPEEALDWLARTLTGKLLHTPTTRLREAAQQGDADLLRAAERLFDAPPAPAPAKEGDDPEHPPQA